MTDADDFIEHTSKPYTNIVKATKTDAKLKYFNVKDYFKKTEVKIFYTLPKASFEGFLKFY